MDPQPTSHRLQGRAVLVPGYVPRTARQAKPNRRWSQDHVVLCAPLRPEAVTRAQSEPPSAPRPCLTLCAYAPPPPTQKNSRRPKLNSCRRKTRSQDRAMPSVRLRPENVTPAPAERSPVPRPRRALFRLRPENVTSAKAEKSPDPRPCLALFPFTTLERHFGPSRTVAGPKTVSCSVPVYVPRTSRRPKPNRHLSQDRVVLCSCLRPKTVTSVQAGQSAVPRPCPALFPSTSRERHVGPSRAVASPKTVPSSIPVYVPRTSRRPKPNSRRSQDRAMLYSRLRPKNVTSAQAEQSPVPRPCRALFLSTSQERHVGPSRTVASPKTMSCSVLVYVPRTSPAQ